MSKISKIRIIAGPNGSGKSTIIDELRTKVNVGFYLNADIIENQLKLKCFNFLQFNFQSKDLDNFIKHIKNSSLFLKFKNSGGTLSDFIFNEMNLFVEQDKLNSYHAALIVQFLIDKFIEKNTSFTYETVMSHKSKIEILQKAKKHNYRIYLYYVSTISPKINIARVENRVKKGGHPVAPEKIESRYYNSLSLLKEASLLSDRTYFIDNSSRKFRLIAEKKGKFLIPLTKHIPNWFAEYIWNKK